jgi:hypothetical protein
LVKDYKNPTQQFKVEKKPECDDPQHEGDRTLNPGDWWMCWPDFVFRCQACYERQEKLKNKKQMAPEEPSQEELLSEAEES